MLLLCGVVGIGLVHAGTGIGICLVCIVVGVVFAYIVALGVIGGRLCFCWLKNQVVLIMVVCCIL